MKILFINDKNREANILERFLSGSIAGGLAQSFIYPLEVKLIDFSFFFLILFSFFFKAVENSHGFTKNRRVFEHFRLC